MTQALAAIVVTGILLPHVLRLQRVPPTTAIVLWLSGLALRALAAVLAAIYVLYFLPRTGLFVELSHWCGRLPVMGHQLNAEGHTVADIALHLPGIALVASLLYDSARTAREVRAARRLVRQAVGRGPRNSLILGGPQVTFAVAGLAHPRVLVSAGALTTLDDDELTAGLDHEQAHIARRHRFVMLFALGCRALGRAIPGCDRSVRELVFHLERDADRWALRRHDDRLALASVICKSADVPTLPRALSNLGSVGAPERLRQLIDDPPAPGVARLSRAGLRALATLMLLCTLVLAATVPAAAVAGAGGHPHRGHHLHHCSH
jgi:Peptidase family M48